MAQTTKKHPEEGAKDRKDGHGIILASTKYCNYTQPSPPHQRNLHTDQIPGIQDT